ncbi:MAG: hypothetical protein K0R48_1350 [Gammaproteobacteria bacterium]|jgi:hypothetical protein|nr:hypothetical protein [Gammaproteobacteria bacterium]
MSDDSKPPKGPILPDPQDPKRVDDRRTNIIDIKETLKERKDKRRQAKTDRRQQGKPEKEKTKKRIKTAVETVESQAPVDPVKKKQKEEREKFNDKKRIERLRAKVEGWLARFKTEVLPIRKASAGNNPTKMPVHPLTSKMTGRDLNVSADTTKQPDAAQQLQNVLAHKKQLQLANQNQNTISTPTPKPPGG